MTTSYEEAVREVAEFFRLNGPTKPDVLRALLAGPPEPTEEEVARVLDPIQWRSIDNIPQRMPEDHRQMAKDHLAKLSLEKAQAVQQLYRSRRNG